MSENYFILNKETGKLELHFEKSTYAALTDAQKSEIKSNFLWGRRSGCWISRAKEPNLYYARKVAESIGLEDAGTEGEPSARGGSALSLYMRAIPAAPPVTSSSIPCTTIWPGALISSPTNAGRTPPITPTCIRA